ncbi:MAG: FKBP-type peptidyl-prolyl cis-trans isomerase [Flavobacteriales bacterium]|jgi:FKBP-type peptidyl-prolyl cis-trans isomerase FklB|nr:FKBP-type peptidyl-prolyl cis-trans isomerase [Flavobacteriales bacterium]
MKFNPIHTMALAASLVLAPVAWTGCAVNGQNTPTPNMENNNDSLSYALGVLFATNVQGQGITDFVPAQIAQAFSDVQAGNAVMTPEQANELVRSTMQAKEAKAGDANREAGLAFLAENKGKDGVVVTDSGLQYRVDREGDGPSPSATDKVTVHYHGTLIDGTTFDSSYDRGQPATFGLNQVITGWTEGLQTMKKGGQTTFYIPSELAYGARATGDVIGANSTLVFKVELLEVEQAD